MYQQSNKNAAVKEIQTYLYLISDRMYADVPRIPIDGIYDSETEAAVIKYQEIKGISQSGAVDYETFTALYNDYSRIIEYEETNGYIFGDGSLPLKENDQNEDVRALHVMISELRKAYPNIPDTGNGSYYSARTGDAVEALSEIFMLPKSRILDRSLYKRMLTEIDSLKYAEQFSL